ncbi:hypothetical protein [Rhodococcus pyridinivorans]
MPTIGELIAAQMDATGRSYRELSKASGDRVKYQTFHELCTAPPKSWPKNVETIRGMAAALDVSETAVVLGYARSLGVEVQGESMLAQQLPASAGRLTPAQRNAIVSLIRAITTEGTHHGTGTEEEQEPRTQAGGPEHGGEARGDRRRTGASMNPETEPTADTGKVAPFTRRNQGDSLPGDDQPAPDLTKKRAARRRKGNGRSS